MVGFEETPRAGDCIAGKYLVEGVLGAGGMGMVLAARHVSLRSQVAIKVLLPEAAGQPEAVERFLREARAAAALQSDHVARVLDVAMLESGAPYLVMEYLTGSNLQRMLRARGPLPVEEATEYLLQVCDAMMEAHALGVVHRDLKPANLFLATRPNGTTVLKVLDFGIAKVRDSAHPGVPEASLTATGVVIGTPHYMAPEQIRSLKLADARSDIWSLGVIAYEMLAGTRPFEAEQTPGVLAAIVADQPVPLRMHRPDLPEAMEAAVSRCLRKDPRDRFQSVRELAAAVEPFRADGRRSPKSTPAHGAGTPAGPPQAVTPVDAPAKTLPTVVADDQPLPASALAAASSAAASGIASAGHSDSLTLRASEISPRPASRLRKPPTLIVGGSVVALAVAALMVGILSSLSSAGVQARTTPEPAATTSAVPAVSGPSSTPAPGASSSNDDMPRGLADVPSAPASSAAAPKEPQQPAAPTSSNAAGHSAPSTSSAPVAPGAKVRKPQPRGGAQATDPLSQWK